MDISNVLVAGGGVLGSQIAFQTAYCGCKVTMWLRSDTSVERAERKLDQLSTTYHETLEAMRTNPKAWCRGLSASAEVSDEEIDELQRRAKEARQNLCLTTDLKQACAGQDLIIECIAENPEQKTAFYSTIAPLMDPTTILATNSSTMLPSSFAEVTGRPERYLALHFANEIWRNNTAEIMGHPGTDPDVFQDVVSFARSISMIPLELHKEQPGYILNSLLVPFLSAAEALLANEVADVETIDTTWMLATGAPLGPFRILDIVGLTTAYNIGLLDPRSQDPTSVQGKVSALLKRYIDEGKTGVSAGAGFYQYH